MSDQVHSLETVRAITATISMACLGQSFRLRVERDAKDRVEGRIFLQIVYDAPCTKTGINQEWKGRKWYLSEYMTEDEIIKTAYAAFESAVKHEVMEGFKVGDIILFNPHIDYRSLLAVSQQEVSRQHVDHL